MADDMRTERLLGTVELVRSRGDPEKGKLCIMSLVARLADEPHGDHPKVASPMIAAFARPINDAMDRQTRQRLIPFAPHIQGTGMETDGERRALLHNALLNELLPRMVTDLQVAASSDWDATGADETARLAAALAETPTAEQPRLVQDPAWDNAALIAPLRVAITAFRDGSSVQQAEAVARLVIAGASRVARPTRRTWYWDRAIDLLDRLCACDVPAAPARTATPTRVQAPA